MTIPIVPMTWSCDRHQTCGNTPEGCERCLVEERDSLRGRLAEAEQERDTLINDVRKTIAERERAYADCAAEHRQNVTLNCHVERLREALESTRASIQSANRHEVSVDDGPEESICGACGGPWSDPAHVPQEVYDHCPIADQITALDAGLAITPVGSGATFCGKPLNVPGWRCNRDPDHEGDCTFALRRSEGT